MENGLYVSMSPIIRAYRRATGDDLTQYGLSDIMIAGDPD